MSNSVILELKSISKCYDLPGETESHYVLKDLDLRIIAGESVSVIGPSGSGKSTLLNIIGALDRPNSGSVLLEGKDLSQLNDKELSTVRNRQVGFVFQLHHLLPQCTVLENVLVPTLVNTDKSSRKGNEERALQLLERVGLGDRLSHRPGQISGGERQRVAVVRALINNPKLLLADEPTGSLDQEASDNLVELLSELNQEENVTLIMVTHSMELAESMSRVLELRDGKLVSKNNR
jgi:ABC-type lipoprotein export system ATPase subunit